MPILKRARWLRGATAAVVMAAPLALAPLAARAQRPATFSAAVVDLDKQAGTVTHSWQSDPQQLRIRAATLQDLIWWSFGLQRYQIQGPGWINEELFDVQASMSAPTPTAVQKELLQQLLQQCFRMRFHYDRKPRPAFLLEQAPHGAKLVPSRTKAFGSDSGWTHLTATGVTTSLLAQDLSHILGRPVLDRTGLRGRYDISLSFAAPPGAPAGSDANPGSSLFTVLRQQLGLMLVPAKIPIPTFQLDSVLRPAARCVMP